MSNETFQITCKTCGSRLNAKTNLIGQTRNCPKCKTPIVIRRDEVHDLPPENGAAVTPIIIAEPSIAPLPLAPTIEQAHGVIENLPERLHFQNRYLILGPDRLVAQWETGKGWAVNVGSGFSPAKKNISAIPDQGTFVLVEIVIGSDREELSAVGGPTRLNLFKISMRGALTSLYRDEGEILHKVDGTCNLNQNQKNLLANYLRQHFMADSLADARGIFESLSMDSGQ